MINEYVAIDYNLKDWVIKQSYLAVKVDRRYSQRLSMVKEEYARFI
jgi:hypothetical protein